MLFLNFNRWLEGQLALNQVMPPARCVDLIVFEQAHHRGGAATEIAVGLMTRVLEYGARYGIDHTSVHSMTLKKWATGRGNVGKEEMKAAANGLLRDQHRMDIIEDDNEADAICLLFHAIEKYGGGSSCSVPTAAAVDTESSEKLTPAR
jgi:Holliday junction resolvasome RuvABC endonuclease subunit